eukprot:scaffold733_cov267-Pinguiococcus_pyrenoidosus.AAC.42
MSTSLTFRAQQRSWGLGAAPDSSIEAEDPEFGHPCGAADSLCLHRLPIAKAKCGVLPHEDESGEPDVDVPNLSSRGRD